jgi:hypothetical protein
MDPTTLLTGTALIYGTHVAIEACRRGTLDEAVFRDAAASTAKTIAVIVIGDTILLPEAGDSPPSA